MRMWTCLTLLAFAVVFVAGCSGEKAEDTLKKAAEEVEGAAETAKEAVEEVAETAAEHAEGAMDEMAGKVKEMLGAEGEEMMGKLSGYTEKLDTMKKMAQTAGNEELDGYVKEAESHLADIKGELGGLEGATEEEVATCKANVAEKMSAVEGLLSKSGDLLGEVKKEIPDVDDVKDKLPSGH